MSSLRPVTAPAVQVVDAGTSLDQRFGDGQRVLVRRPFRLLLQAKQDHRRAGSSRRPTGLERRAALDQLRYGLAAMRRRDVERRFAGDQLGLLAPSGIKAEIQHQPHCGRIARPREIGEHAQALGLMRSTSDRFAAANLRASAAFARAQAAKRIIAFERNDDAAFFEQLEDVRAAPTRASATGTVPFLSGSNRSRRASSHSK